MLFTVNRLHEYGACVGILRSDAFFKLFANHSFGGDVVLIHSHNQIVHNQLCNLAMHVTISGFGLLVVLKTVATVEVLADVVADIVANNEATSGMLVDKFINVKH